MNLYKVTEQVTKSCSWFLKNLGFKNIESFSKNISDVFNIHMKNGLTAQIKFNNPGVRGIYWSVDDFQNQAMKRWKYKTEPCSITGQKSKYFNATCWQDVYDESKFEKALETMIDKHDATIGISWETINYFLDNMCLKKIKNEEIFK